MPDPTAIANALDADLGEQLRRASIATRKRQVDVAADAGVSQSLVSRMECGMGGQVPIATWLAVAAAVETDFTVDLLSRSSRDGKVDDTRIRMADLVAHLSADGGWVADRSVTASLSGAVRDLDLTLRCADRRSVAVVRVWDVIPSTRAVIADLDAAMARAVAAKPDASVAGLVVVRPSVDNRRRITEGRAAFDSRFVGSGSRWTGTLTRNTRQRLPPDAMLWVDGAISRLIPTGLFLQRPRNRKARRLAW